LANFWAEKDFAQRARLRVRGSIDKANTNLHKSKIRSVYWRVFLGCLGPDKKKWSQRLQEDRKRYQAERDKLMANPTDRDEGDLEFCNPLSQSNNNPWADYYRSVDLCKEIEKDISRTHPSKSFFQDKKTQKMMLNILFVWAKRNPEYSYRQGMNELLSPLLLSVHEDATYSDKKMNREKSGLAEAVLETILDKSKIEHDSFYLFDRLMLHMKKYFAVKQAPTTKSKSRGPLSQPVRDPETPIVLHCTALQEGLLKMVDRPLYQHLKDNDVHPTLYLLRWIRLLFSREFLLDDVRLIWDHIFAAANLDTSGKAIPGKTRKGTTTDPVFPLIDYMCVSMCQFVRGDLMGSDNSACLRRLMRFPPVGDMSHLINRALILLKGLPRPPSQPRRPSDARKAKPPPPPNPYPSKGGPQSKAGRPQPSRPAGNQRAGKFQNLLSYVRSGAASLPGVLSRSGGGGKEARALRFRVSQLEGQLSHMNKMGEIISSIVDTLQGELVQESNEKPNMSIVLRSLAELKSVKDVLIGRIHAESVLEHIKPSFKPSTPTNPPMDPLGQMMPTKVISTAIKPVKPSPLSIEKDPKGNSGVEGKDSEIKEKNPVGEGKNSSVEKKNPTENPGISGMPTGIPGMPTASGRDEDTDEDIQVVNEVKAALLAAGIKDPEASPVDYNGSNKMHADNLPPLPINPRPPQSKAELMKRHVALLDDLLAGEEDDDNQPKNSSLTGKSDGALKEEVLKFDDDETGESIFG